MKATSDAGALSDTPRIVAGRRFGWISRFHAPTEAVSGSTTTARTTRLGADPAALASASISQCGARRTTTRSRSREDDRVAGHLALRQQNERARGLVLRLGAAGRLRRRATGASLLAGWCSRCARTCSLPLTSRSPRGAKRAAACGTRGRAARPSPAAPEAARCIL